MVSARRPDGRLYFVTGKSRSGKTAWTAQQVDGARRLLAWDPPGDWIHRHGCRQVTSLAELREWVKPGAPVARLAYHAPGMTEPGRFEVFCRLAWVWIRAGLGVLVVDELASVTHPGKAPAAWGDILRAGLRYGPQVYAITHRPAESDKTALANASVIHCHAMANPRDRQFMAAALDVPARQVEALKPLEWLERHDTGELLAGRVRFRRPARSGARQAG